MSSSGNNGKKSGSGNNSTTLTPASTPITSHNNMTNGQSSTQNSPPPNNAPKYGTLVPNRIFVGGISANTTEAELLQLFSNYGQVKAAKIIQDRAGVSKGYGFITFESEDDARRLQRECDNIVLRERKLNIAPAIKKQPFTRTFDAASPPAITGGNAPYFFQPGSIPFYHQSGVTYYPPQPPAPGDPTGPQPPVYQPPSVYPPQSGPPQSATYQPVMFPAQPIYVPPQYTIPMPYDYNYYPNNGPYVFGNQNNSQHQISQMQRPGSPPRSACYGQQVPYNIDTVYYNVPMYGTVEASSIYQEPLEMTNGAINEDYMYNGKSEQKIQTHYIQNQHYQSVSTPLSLHRNSDRILQDVDRLEPSVPALADNVSQNYEQYPTNIPLANNNYYINGQKQQHNSTFQYNKNNYSGNDKQIFISKNGYRNDRNKDSNNHQFNPRIASNMYEANSDREKSKLNLTGYGSKNHQLSNNRGPAFPTKPSSYKLTSLPDSQQVHSSQHFMPPSRRNRRNVRRNQAPLSEIGAGDAPLPPNDVADTVKKLDSLKL